MLKEFESHVLVSGTVPPNQAYEGGSTRSEQDVRYDLISPHGMKALARRLALGAKRHGERNWEKGGEKFRQATISHMLGHLTNYMANPNQEDTDALICNAMFLSHFEAKRLETLEVEQSTLSCKGRVGIFGTACCFSMGHEGPCEPRPFLTTEETGL